MMKSLFSFLFIIFVVAPSFAQEEPAWNQFRGPNHENKSFSTDLLKQWPEGGPKLLWKIETLGEGYSHFSFHGDKMFTMGDIGDDCCVLALDPESGKTIWKTRIGKSGAFGRYHGPRATPAIDGKFVFAYSHFGDLACLEIETGKILWNKNVVTVYDATCPMWGFASSPIFENENLILPIGGTKGALIAFTKQGELLWQSTEITGDHATYCCAVPVTIDGVRQFLLFSFSGVYGVRASDGKKLWFIERPSERPVCSDPACLGNVVFVSSAYNMGANAYRVEKSGDLFNVREIYADKRLQNHHGGVVRVNEHLYFTTERELVCLEINGGEVKWRDRSVGKGSVTYADGMLIVRSESGDGTIALVEANSERYVEKGRFDQPDRSDKNSWSYPTIVNGKMYIRDQGLLLCYELK